MPCDATVTYDIVHALAGQDARDLTKVCRVVMFSWARLPWPQAMNSSSLPNADARTLLLPLLAHLHHCASATC